MAKDALFQLNERMLFKNINFIYYFYTNYLLNNNFHVRIALIIMINKFCNEYQITSRKINYMFRLTIA